MNVPDGSGPGHRRMAIHGPRDPGRGAPEGRRHAPWSSAPLFLTDVHQAGAIPRLRARRSAAEQLSRTVPGSERRPTHPTPWVSTSSHVSRICQELPGARVAPPRGSCCPGPAPNRLHSGTVTIPQARLQLSPDGSSCRVPADGEGFPALSCSAAMIAVSDRRSPRNWAGG